METESANIGTTLIITAADSDLIGETAEELEVTIGATNSTETIGPFALRETRADSGEFTVNLTLTSDFTTPGIVGNQSSGQTFELEVNDVDVLCIVFSPKGDPSIDFTLSETIDVENVPPEITNVLPEHGDVVDDEDVIVAHAGASRRRGSVIVIVVPSPWRVSPSMRPPMTCTNLRTIVSPSPVPPALVV